MGEMAWSRLDEPEVSARLFYPRRGWSPPDLLRVTVEPNLQVTGHLHRGWRGAPAILFFHGNGEVAEDYTEVGLMFRRLGVSFLAVDYRGYGASDGQPTASTMLADARTIWRAFPQLLAEAGLTPSVKVVMGRSLGSAPALEIAAREADRPTGVIIDSGFCHTEVLLERLGIPLWPPLAPEEDIFAHHRKVARMNRPLLVIHGEEDGILPVTEGVALFEGAGEVDKQLFLVERASHNDLMVMAGEEYFRRVVTFVNALGH